jgi:hypothetical protein
MIEATPYVRKILRAAVGGRRDLVAGAIRAGAMSGHGC